MAYTLPTSQLLAEHTVSAAESGLRLDAYLGGIMPELSVRGRKRLLEQGLVLVNGKARPPLYRLREGNTVSVMEAPPLLSGEAEDLEKAIRLVALTDSFAVFYKPAGLHTAAISGKAQQSLESALPRLWPCLYQSGLDHAPAIWYPQNVSPLMAEALRLLPHPTSAQPPWPGTLPPLPVLLSRLDRDTSGLVAAALDKEAHTRFRDMEADGRVVKYYLALVHGDVTKPLACMAELDTADRRKTRVCQDPESLNPDKTRHTLMTPVGDAAPLCPQLQGPVTLVIARITRGARHQIRAHLAALGHPIVGDALYGDADSAGPLYLHHACLVLPEFTAFCPPPW